MKVLVDLVSSQGSLSFWLVAGHLLNESSHEESMEKRGAFLDLFL